MGPDNQFAEYTVDYHMYRCDSGCDEYHCLSDFKDYKNDNEVIKIGHLICRELLNKYDEDSGTVIEEFRYRTDGTCVLNCKESRNVTNTILSYYDELSDNHAHPQYLQYCEVPGQSNCPLTFQDGDVFYCKFGSTCPSNYIQDPQMSYKCL